MTLSGKAAVQRPDVDLLVRVPLGIVTHSVREIDKRNGMRRLSAGPGTSIGTVDFETGVYYTAAAAMTEADRRAAGLRRNGQPRRKTGAQ